jgi:FAD/FMN-containing dehydrogenase
MAAIDKLAFNLSKLGSHALEARWWLEKRMDKKDAVATRNELMSPNIEFLNNYGFNNGRRTCILQEYYVPHDKLAEFTAGLQRIQDRHAAADPAHARELRTLNITVRDVGQDHDTALTYAKRDMFSLVLDYNEATDAAGQQRQADLTHDLVDWAIACGGTFYLPYQRHYSKAQLRAAYPEVDGVLAKKREYDPSGMFSNKWYETYSEFIGVGKHFDDVM